MISCTPLISIVMQVKKENIGKSVYSRRIGKLIKVTPENYDLLKTEFKSLYVTSSKKSANQNSTDTSGEDNS